MNDSLTLTYDDKMKEWVNPHGECFTHKAAYREALESGCDLILITSHGLTPLRIPFAVIAHVDTDPDVIVTALKFAASGVVCSLIP